MFSPSQAQTVSTLPWGLRVREKGTSPKANSPCSTLFASAVRLRIILINNNAQEWHLRACRQHLKPIEFIILLYHFLLIRVIKIKS
jgi:hypothetical protein